MSWYYFSKQRKYSKGNILNDKFLTFHLISSSKILLCRYYFYFKDFSFFLFRAKIWLPFERQYEFDTDKFIRFFFLFLNRWAQKLYIENTWSMLKNFKYRKSDHNQSYFYHENVTKIHNDKDTQCTYTLFIPVLFELRRFIADRKKKNGGSWDDILHESYPTWLLLRQKRATGGGDKTPQQNGFLVISWPVTT